MSDEIPEKEQYSAAIAIQIPRPSILVGAAWLVLGLLLLLCFLLANYSMGNMPLNGFKVMDLLARRDASVSRIFDDEGFLMMVVVPLVYLSVALLTTILGILTLVRRRVLGVVSMAVVALFGFVFSIFGAIVIHNSGSEILVFAKLLPKPAVGYWLAMAIQFLIFGVSAGYWLLVRNQRVTAPVNPTSY